MKLKKERNVSVPVCLLVLIIQVTLAAVAVAAEGRQSMDPKSRLIVFRDGYAEETVESAAEAGKETRQREYIRDISTKLFFNALIPDGAVPGLTLMNEAKGTGEENLKFAGPNFRLGPNDKINLTVYGDFTFSMVYFVTVNHRLIPAGEETNTILSDREGLNYNYLLFKLINKIDVKGLTTGELADKVSGVLNSEIKGDFSVVITLLGAKYVEAFITGRIDSPGMFKFDYGMRLVDFIKLAGGPLENAYIRAVRIARKAGGARKCDLYTFFRYGDLEQNPIIEDGDIVELLPAVNIVKLGGNLNSRYEYQAVAGETLAEMLEVAGGFKEYPGKNYAYYLYHYGENGVVDRQRVAVNGGAGLNVEFTAASASKLGQSKYMGAGDAVYFPIPTLYRTNVVVMDPEGNETRLAISPDDTLFDVLSIAGVGHSADLTRVSLFRPGGGEKDYIREYNLVAYFLEGDETQNPALRDQDMIVLAGGNTDIIVMGNVRKPGRYSFDPNMGIRGYVAEAGGMIVPSTTINVYIVRPNRENPGGNEVKIKIPNKQYLNFHVAPGDVILVNQKDKPINWLKDNFVRAYDAFQLDWFE